MNLHSTYNITTPTSAFGMAFPTVDRFMLRASYVSADIQPDALLNCYCSDDSGASFDYTAKYINVLQVAFPGEPNPTEWNKQPWPTLPQTLSMGCRLGIDVGERQDIALHVDAEFTQMGTVSGNQVSPVYRTRGYVGCIGGAAGVSDRPAHHGGGKWFGGDPVGTPFDWPVEFNYAGHWKKPGARINALLFTMNGGGTTGRLIKTGRFEIWI